MPKFKIHGMLYEPDCDGADKNGYIHFYDVFDAPTQESAMEMAYEDYGEYNALQVCGTVSGKTDEKIWLAQNPD